MKVRAPNWSMPMKEILEIEELCKILNISFAKFVRDAINYSITIQNHTILDKKE